MSGLPPGGWACAAHGRGSAVWFTARDGGHLAGILVVLVLTPAALIVPGLIVVRCLPGHLPDPSAGGELVDPAFGPDRWPHARWPGRRAKVGTAAPDMGITPDPRVVAALVWSHSRRTWPVGCIRWLHGSS